MRLPGFSGPRCMTATMVRQQPHGAYPPNRSRRSIGKGAQMGISASIMPVNQKRASGSRFSRRYQGRRDAEEEGRTGENQTPWARPETIIWMSDGSAIVPKTGPCTFDHRCRKAEGERTGST